MKAERTRRTKSSLLLLVVEKKVFCSVSVCPASLAERVLGVVFTWNESAAPLMNRAQIEYKKHTTFIYRVASTNSHLNHEHIWKASGSYRCASLEMFTELSWCTTNHRLLINFLNYQRLHPHRSQTAVYLLDNITNHETTNFPCPDN